MAQALTLFCLPYAGASAVVYQPWRRWAPSWLAVEPVELPGHGSRLGEPLRDEFDVLVEQLADELAPRLPMNYALFGHSLGALIAYELAHAFAARGMPAPAALFVSGASAPSRRDDGRYRGLVGEERLKEELRCLGGTSDEVLDDAELMALMLPVLAADFRLCASFVRRERTPLACPLHVFGGTRDATVPLPTLAAWQRETCGEFSCETFDGGHFFIKSHERALWRRFESLVAQRLALAV